MIGGGDDGARRECAVCLEEVSFGYGTPLLEHVNLCIGERESLCVVGPNGGGKSTLLKLILGLLEPQSGSVRVFGETARRGRRKIGYMPQHLSYDPLFPVSVMDIVLMGRVGGIFARYRDCDVDVAAAALREVELEGFGERPFSRLSGGQRQRVLVARALVCEPDLLLLDEPTSNIDLAGEDRFYKMLSRLNERMAIVLVTHDTWVVSSVVRSVACVSGGQVHVHPTAELTGDMIQAMYGGDVRAIVHDHRCDDPAHGHG